MKKFKYFAFVLLSALCLFSVLAFGGCKGKTEGEYVADSFSYTFDNEYSWAYYVNVEFKISVPAAGKYKVEYTVTPYGDDGKQSKSTYTALTASKSEELTISATFSFERLTENKKNTKANLSGVKVTLIEEEYDNSRYAIGFGAAAGALLVCLTAVFILDKTGVFKKRK